ncbi:MAG: hypothetical protein LC800_09025 [Acidobacteria bacterium]|nr:hypothetical protein [Acidobacteriota bacterium]
MPKIPARNQPNYKIGGGELNEYEYNQQHGQLTTEERNPFELPQAQAGGGEEGEAALPQSPQEAEAERIRQVMEAAQRKAQAGRKGGKATVSGVHPPAAAAEGGAKSGGGKRAAKKSAKKSAKKLAAAKKAGGAKESAAKKSAAKKSAAKKAAARKPTGAKKPAAAKKVATKAGAKKSAKKSAKKTGGGRGGTKSAARKGAAKSARKRGAARKSSAGGGGGLLSAVAKRVGRVVALVEGTVKPGAKGSRPARAGKKGGARRR